MRRWVAVTDVLSVGGALLGAYAMRYGVLPSGRPVLTAAVVITLVTVAAFALLGLYGDDGTRPAAELRRSMLGITLALLAVTVVQFWTDVYLARTWLALTWVMAVALLVASRVAWRVSLRRSVG